jgi:hypothetical protein
VTIDSGSASGDGEEGTLHRACGEPGRECSHADGVVGDIGPTVAFLSESGSLAARHSDSGTLDSGRLDTGGDSAPGDEAVDCFAHGLAHLVRALGPADALTCAARVILQLSGSDRGTSNLPGMAVRGVDDRTHFRPSTKDACSRRGA